MFRRRRNSPSTVRVLVTDDLVRHELSDGETQEIRWSELREVKVLTTDQGPLEEDVWFALLGEEGGCVVPQFAVDDDLLDRLQALPGFDDEALIQAMSSVRLANFSVWRRDATR